VSWLNFWPRVLGSVVIQLYAGECTPSVDRALSRDVEAVNFVVVPIPAA